MAYPSPRRLQLRRGNAAAIASYLGFAGELVVDTTNWTLYVHDGVTVGGYAATVNTASISGNINSILNGTAVFGNLIPSANVVYSLGNITHQWNDLFVSNNTIFVGGVPLGIDATGNLTINGNVIPTLSYVNTVVANVTVDLSSYALNANVTAANVGLKGYVDQANTIQSAQLTSANLGIIGYIDQANTIQSAQVNAANLAITAANVGMKGYVDASIGNIAPAYSNANVASYLPTYDGNIAANISKAGYTWTFGTDGTLTLPGPNPGIYASDNSTIYTNYLATTTLSTAQINGTNSGDHLIIQTNNLWSWQFNSDGSTAFPGNVTIEGNLFVNGNVNYISVNNISIGDNIINLADLNPADSLDLGLTAHRTVNSLLQHTGLVRDASANQWRLFSNVVQNPGTTVDFTDAIYDDLQLGNITSPTITAINNNISAANAAWAFANTIQSQQISAANVGIIGYIDQGNTIQAAAITAANVGLKGYVDFANTVMKAYVDGQIVAANANVSSSGGTNYSNVNVAAYLSTATINTTGNITAGNLFTSGALYVANITTTGASGNISGANYITANYFVGNGALLTGLSSSYSNVQVATYLPTYTGVVTASNVAVNGNVTAQYLFGNGSQLTGIVASGSSYSNVQVATYLQDGNIANISVAGNVTATYFVGNGALLTGIVGGASNYGNVDVRNFLKTGDGASRLIQGYYANIDLGATARLFSFGATAKSYFGHDGQLGNASINWVRADNGDVRISTNNAAYNWIFDNTGNLTLPGATAGETIATSGGYITVGNLLIGQGGSLFNFNNDSWALYGNRSDAGTSITIPSNDSAGSGQPIRIDNQISNVEIVSGNNTWTFSTDGNLTLPGNVAAINYANGVSVLSGLGGSGTNYSNVNVKAYTETMGFQNYSNVNVAAYLSTATINTTGNITAAYISGNISITGNVTGTSSNVTLQAGAYTSVFDNQGNVTVPRLFTAGNIQTAGYFVGNALGTTAAYTGNVTVGGNLTIIGTKSNVPVKTGGFVAQNTAVSIDSITAQWLNTGGPSANQLQLAALNGNVSILYTYTFQDGTGGSTTGGSSSTTLANLSFGWTSIGNPSGVAGDMYNVLVSLPGTNAYRITAMTGSGYSDNVLTVERLI
jgi:hypothetical protein